MTSRLAPESPRPLSVISENYFRQLNNFPIINNEKKFCLFGMEYERELCFYLAKHIEANCDDRVCLIAEESQWIIPVQERLFLNKPIHFIDCTLHSNIIEQQLPNYKFDRIILLNCLHKITSRSISPINLIRKLLTNDGRLVIIFREPIFNTLPLPIEVEKKWFYAHGNYTRHIKQLQRHQSSSDLDICQRIETIKFSMKKLHWFSLLYHRMFYPLTLIDRNQIIDGLRRLNETYFKYVQDMVELHERLTYLTVQKNANIFSRVSETIQPSNRLLKRFEPNSFNNRIWHSQLSITEEMNELLNLRKQNQK